MTKSSCDALRDRVRRRFRERFGHSARLSVAPGRVNLIGEHTDYNDGFVLPIAIDREIAVAFRPRPDDTIVAHAMELDAEATVIVGERPLGDAPGWLAYAGAIATAIAERSAVAGADLVIGGNVPVGAGLSSSAALGVALARAFAKLARIALEPREVAALVQRAEWDAMGVRCGIMDPFASAASREGSATLLDCRSLDVSYVPVPHEAAVVVMDTATRRTLAGSAYNERRDACERAVRILAARLPGITALRDVTPSELVAARASMDDVAFRRAMHVVQENARVHELARALGDGELDRAGALMNESHASLRDLYEVSSPELDLITAIAREERGCFGARMTGAGFGGCAVALVDAGRVAEWAARVENEYRARSARAGALMRVAPSAGAHVID